MEAKRPDLALLDDAVAPRVLDAMRAASTRLAQLGVRHLLVGGLAVGAYGHPRATKDVDFLVGEEAFEHHAGGFVTMKPGIPIQVSGVAIDLLSARPDEALLTRALDEASATRVPVAPPEVLIYLKLRSPRQKDLADVVELIKAGLDPDPVRAHLAAHAPSLLPRLDRAMHAARAETED